MRSLRAVAVLGVVLLVVVLPLLPGDATVQELAIDPHYLLVSSQRVSRTDFTYTYRARVMNRGPVDMLGVTATLTSLSAHTAVVAGALTFGDVPAGSAVLSSNTFTIRQNRSVPFQPGALVWQLAGHARPPANTPPVAQAGPDQTVLVHDTVHLDGSTSSDADGQRLTFAWRLTVRPPGSTAILSDATLARPTFVVDRPGTYAAELVVHDGIVDSAPDMVIITT
jgi:hypothetical protein